MMNTVTVDSAVTRINLITTDKQLNNSTQSLDTKQATLVYCDAIQYNRYTINTIFLKPIMASVSVLDCIIF